MNYSLYLNGVFENVLDEIIIAQNNNSALTCYLQPYASKAIVKLRSDPPSSDSPITAYISITSVLSAVRYKGNITGWEDKQEIEPDRLLYLNNQIEEYQPGEKEIYMYKDGKLCKNLISVNELTKLDDPIPVVGLVKIINDTPLKIKTTAGGWSYVNELSENDEKEIVKRFNLEDSSINIELDRRNNLWDEITQNNSATRIAPQILKELRVYGGAAGIWKDTELTGQYTADGKGITVSVLHTGTSYPDDLFEDGIIYHYPHTNRHPSFDNNEIEATKNSKRLGVPLFVITHNESNQSLRDVNRGWVEMWDDDAEEFLITFSEEQPEVAPTLDEETPFVAFENASHRRRAMVRTRPNQGRFRIGVLARYGCKCVVCDIDNAKLLDAAHLIDKRFEGTDDVRNGLVLCKNHHTAFDKQLFKIDPETLELVFNETTADDIKITRTYIDHLESKPHILALKWAWDNA